MKRRAGQGDESMRQKGPRHYRLGASEDIERA
jgi:hypothetical protein